MKKFILSICLLSILMISFSPALAAAPQAEGLTVSPPLSEINLDPGTVYNGQIKLNNPTKEIVQMYPIARNFSASGETGTPLIESPETDPSYGLASWITFNQTKIVLTNEQEVIFKYKITVPQNAEPGGHYASILFASQPPKPDEKVSQVALASMVGSLILGKVSGDIVEQAEVREFSTKQLFFFKPPVDFVLRITNSGNVHIKPTGDIVVTNFGKKIQTTDFNPSKGNILPSSTRKFENLSFKGNFWSFGRFKVNLAAVYGSTNQPLTASLVFWIIPWWLIVIIALIIIVIIYIIWRKKRKKKKKPQISFANMPPPPPPPTKKRIILQ